MSLLEDALRRHGAEAGRDSRAAAPSPAQPAAHAAPAPAAPASAPAPASPPASLSAEPSASVIAPAPAPATASPEAPAAETKSVPAAGTPLDEASPATGSAPFAARTLISHVLPVVVLLLILAVAWLALQQGQRRATEVSPSRNAAEAPPSATDGTALHTATPARHEGSAGPGATAEADGTPTVDAAAAAGKTIIDAEKDAVPDAMADATELPHATGDAAVPRLDSVPQVVSATSPPPAAATAAMPREKQVWPLFSVRGIADGHEKIAILGTGEMLTVGDTSRTGARLTRLAPDMAWFTWKGETKGLRKGESSDKPLQDE